MLFFERILSSKKNPDEKRRASRYAVGPGFPMKAVLNLVGRDEFGVPLKSADGRGWDWVGRLVNFSAAGVNIQLPPATAAFRGDSCSLVLTLASYQLTIPCRIAHLRPHSDSILFGLKFDFAEKDTPEGYHQLLELVAFGASLKPVKGLPAKADASGYIVEEYCGDFASQLTVWRAAPNGPVQWFEFQLAEYCVRGSSETRTLEFSTGNKLEKSQPVPAAQIDEIHQLFRWVVPNIARAVPVDIRNSLQQFAA